MTLLSAFDDFVSRSVAAVPGWLGKLEYVSGLRDATCTYHHWGLAKVHGVTSAQLAISQAHSMVFLQVLRTPIRKLIEDACLRAADKGKSDREYLAELRANVARLVPEDVGGGSKRHFSSILEALWSVAGAQTSTDRAA